MCGIDEEQSEVSGQRAAGSGQRTEDRGQRSEVSANGASHDSLGFQPQGNVIPKHRKRQRRVP